jgi:hypothetical protein
VLAGEADIAVGVAFAFPVQLGDVARPVHIDQFLELLAWRRGMLDPVQPDPDSFPAPRWLEGPDENSFLLDFADAGRIVRAEVLLDACGAPRDFRTDDRYADLPGGLVRTRWSTPVEGWVTRGGRPCFTEASAVWLLPDGPFRYATLKPIDVRVT